MNQTETIVSFLEDKTGFLFDKSGKEKVSFLVKKRLSSTGIDSEVLYFDHIRSTGGNNELKNLISEVTVGETFFFRNPDHWQAFRKFVLPRVIESKKNPYDRKIRIWSAGCSSGEEPYTMGMALCEEGRVLKNMVAEITATDIDKTALKIAEKGLYTKNSFRGVDSYWIDKYFTPAKRNFQINNKIREMVSFKMLNLASISTFPPEYSNFDIIFCRNVLMYFRPDVQNNILNKLVSLLAKNGYLFLGHSESILTRESELSSIRCCNTFVYRKKTHRKKWPERYNDIKIPAIISEKKEPLRPVNSIRSASVQPEIQKPITARKGYAVQSAEKAIQNHYAESYMHYLNENYTAAIKVLQDKETKMNYQELILCSLIHINMSSLDDADRYRQKALEISDILPEVHMIEAMIKEARKDYDEAVKANMKAVFLDNTFFVPWFRLGHICQSTGNTGKKSQYFKNALKALINDEDERIKLFCGEVSAKLLEDICKQSI